MSLKTGFKKDWFSAIWLLPIYIPFGSHYFLSSAKKIYEQVLGSRSVVTKVLKKLVDTIMLKVTNKYFLVDTKVPICILQFIRHRNYRWYYLVGVNQWVVHWVANISILIDYQYIDTPDFSYKGSGSVHYRYVIQQFKWVMEFLDILCIIGVFNYTDIMYVTYGIGTCVGFIFDYIMYLVVRLV